MKTTFDLPDTLIRAAKVLAAQQSRPLRDLVAEALREKLGRSHSAERHRASKREAWNRWKARLQQLPDGTWLNREGIESEEFFQALDQVRREPWTSRNPLGSTT